MLRSRWLASMPASPSDGATGPRHRAREAALQILYLWEIGGVTPQQAIGIYFKEHAADATESQRAFATTIVDGTVADLPAIDPIIAAHSQHWRLERLAVIDRLVLRLAVWELRHEADTPAPVVINEAIELARRFGTDDSVRFVNGVLDAIRKGLKA
jgi:transcription antitermination protein NusB